jgi:hypothetical protein
MIKILIKHLDHTFSEALVPEAKDLLSRYEIASLDKIQTIYIVRKGNADGMPYYHETDKPKV